MSFLKGQMNITIAIVSAVGMIVASVFTSWATSSNRIAATEKTVSVIEERENNHFSELTKSIEKIDKKLDLVIESRSIIKK